jgi:hypothetical protein
MHRMIFSTTDVSMSITYQESRTNMSSSHFVQPCISLILITTHISPQYEFHKFPAFKSDANSASTSIRANQDQEIRRGHHSGDNRFCVASSIVGFPDLEKAAAQ